jgi:hypothetical protein
LFQRLTVGAVDLGEIAGGKGALQFFLGVAIDIGKREGSTTAISCSTTAAPTP